MRLKDKVAIVTGASMGIGEAIARRYASEGAKVAINYLKSEDKAKAIVSEINSGGGEAKEFKADVSIVSEIEKIHGPGSVVDYYGLTPQEDRQDNIRKFQSDPKCRFMVGTPATGGYGITLTAANTVIYYSNGYDLEKRLQSEDRAHRIGQKKSVTYVDIIADETVDEKIVKALRKKINIASEVLGEELKSWI